MLLSQVIMWHLFTGFQRWNNLLHIVEYDFMHNIIVTLTLFEQSFLAVFF